VFQSSRRGRRAKASKQIFKEKEEEKEGSPGTGERRSQE
jgi:hypothetical protein